MKIIISLILLLLLTVCYSKQLIQKTPNEEIVLDTMKDQQDTMRCIFTNDTIILHNTQKIGQIIYTERQNDLDVFFQYIFPFFTLILGIFIEKWFESRSNKKRIIKAGKRWIAELYSLNDPISNQRAAFNKFITEYCDDVDRYMIPSPTIYQALDTNNFKALKKDELLEYLESCLKQEESIKVFNKISGMISILEYLHNLITTKFNEFKNKSCQYIESFNQNLQLYRSRLMELATCQGNAETKMIDNNDYDEITRLFEHQIISHMDNGDINPFELKETFFKPTTKIFSKYYTNPKINNFVTPLVECQNNIKGLELEKIYIKENLTKISESYERLNRTIVETLPQIEKCRK